MAKPGKERILRVRSFDGEACSVAFRGCEEVAGDLQAILRGWEVAESRDERAAGAARSLVRLSRTPSGYLRVSRWSRTPSKCRDTFRTHNTDALFGVHYDLLSWYVEAQRSRPCLHCAAVRFGDGLVAFPNTTRAGKTTLAVELALRGRQVFCDDWLPVRASDGHGIALGLLPWLRLPPPPEVRARFKPFLDARRGPKNRRWMYVKLREEELAAHGAAAPIRGLVLLDRRATAAASLEPVAKERMLGELIQQNYAHGVPAARTLEVLLSVVEGAHCLRLRYGSVREAAAVLDEAFGEPQGHAANEAGPWEPGCLAGTTGRSTACRA